MNSARSTTAPATPQSSALCWRCAADAKALKDDQKDEEIVDAERGLNGVAAHPFQRRLAAMRDGDPAGKSGRRDKQHARPEPRKHLGVAVFRLWPGNSESASSSAATTA